jgi:hypothetical protein
VKIIDNILIIYVYDNAKHLLALRFQVINDNNMDFNSFNLHVFLDNFYSMYSRVK